MFCRVRVVYYSYKIYTLTNITIFNIYVNTIYINCCCAKSGTHKKVNAQVLEDHLQKSQPRQIVHCNVLALWSRSFQHTEQRSKFASLYHYIDLVQCLKLGWIVTHSLHMADNVICHNLKSHNVDFAILSNCKNINWHICKFLLPYKSRTISQFIVWSIWLRVNFTIT